MLVDLSSAASEKAYHLYQYFTQTEADDEEPNGFVFV